MFAAAQSWQWGVFEVKRRVIEVTGAFRAEG